MRLLQIVPYYAPAWAYGGPPKVMWEEAKELVVRGHDIEVFTTDALDEKHRGTSGLRVEDGILIHRFENVSNWLAYHHYRFTPRGLRRQLRNTRAEAIHLSEMRHELAIAAWWLARKRDIPLVISAHGTLPRRKGPKAQLRKLYDRRWVTPMIDGAAALLAQTDHEADLYLRAGAAPDRVHLLPLGVDLPPPPTDDAPDLGVPEGEPYILFLGRIHELKGVLQLIDAYLGIGPEHARIHLVIAGRDDGALAAAKAKAAGSARAATIHFPGPIYGGARFEVYRRAALFAILPTHFEETSLASLEAASVGTPLLVNAASDVPFLDEFGAGHRVSKDADLADALEAALSADLAAQGAAASRMVAERHAWPVVAERLEGILEQSTR